MGRMINNNYSHCGHFTSCNTVG